MAGNENYVGVTRMTRAQHCNHCEEACCKEGVIVIGDTESLCKRRKSVASFETREVWDGADLREMLAELQGRCSVCFFAG